MNEADISTSVQEDIHAVRSRICNGTLIALAIIAIPALAGSLYRIAILGWFPLIGGHIFLWTGLWLVTFFRRSLPYSVRAGYIVGIMFAIGVGALLQFGHVGGGVVFLAMAPLMATVLFGGRNGISVGLASLLSISAIGLYALQNDQPVTLDIGLYAKHPFTWLALILIMAMSGGVVLVAIYKTNEYLMGALKQSRQREMALKAHEEHLETLVDERTAEVTEKAAQLEAALAREKEYNALQEKFTSLVGHEFRTPLSIIDGTAQRLIRRKDKLDPEEVETRAKTVRSAVSRMIGLIDTTLHAARLDAGKIELKLSSCNIRELIREVCDRQAEVSRSHEFQVEIDDLPSEIIADPARIDQVFTNLLSNAVKYAPKDPFIEIKGWVDGGDALVSVTDYGVGIPENELPQMFNRFFRAKTAEGIKGTGIGLSVVKEFVEMHGGAIEVASTEGEGSTFTVRLPIGDDGQ